MGFFDRLLRPYESLYNPTECRQYCVHFIDACRFAESEFPNVLNTVARRIYAVYYTALYHLLLGRPFEKGELALQVMKAMCGASLVAQGAKRHMAPDDVLTGAAQIYGYCTELLMRTQSVSPGRAFQLRMFDECFQYVMNACIRDGILAACCEKLQLDSQPGKRTVGNGEFHGHKWGDVMSIIGEDHFCNAMWMPAEDFSRRLLAGEIVWTGAQK